MKFKTKNLIFIGLFLFIFLGIWQNCHAVDLLLNYPEVGGQSLNTTSSLPQLINYIYKFALLACGITALVSMIIGAFQYVASAGDSSKAGDAKDRITQALLGVLILLASVLILRTINPDLVTLSLSLPTTTTPTTTTTTYYCWGRCISTPGTYGPWGCKQMTNITSQDSDTIIQQKCYYMILAACGVQFEATAKTEKCP